MAQLTTTSLAIILLASFPLVHLSELYHLNPMDLAFKDEIKEIQLRKEEKPTRISNMIESLVTFYLYTRENNEEILTKNITSLLVSSYMWRKPTKVIIHGYYNNQESTMSQSLKDNILQMEDVNVITVDWGKIAKGINYMWVAKQASIVGDYLASFLDFLVLNASDPKDIHIIGHSLGAHVAGFAGAAMVTGRPARITGLDPAKPEFSRVTADKRLDPTDADFVDCIHTCGGWLGIMEPTGHVDFYANGGRNVQPGCHIFDFGRCSHMRSHQYYGESILGHLFDAFQCPSEKDISPDCKGAKEQMGYYTRNSARGVFYAATKKRYPYGIVSNKTG